MAPNATPQLTKIEAEVLRVFHERAAANVAPPTIRELARHFGWASPTAARKHVEALERKGVLTIQRGVARGACSATPWGALVGVLERFGEPAATTIGVPSYLLPPEGVRFGFQQFTDDLDEFGVVHGDMLLAGPPGCAARPRFVVVSREGVPVAVRPEDARGKRYGVVVAVLRSYVAEALR